MFGGSGLLLHRPRCVCEKTLQSVLKLARRWDLRCNQCLQIPHPVCVGLPTTNAVTALIAKSAGVRQETGVRFEKWVRQKQIWSRHPLFRRRRTERPDTTAGEELAQRVCAVVSTTQVDNSSDCSPPWVGVLDLEDKRGEPARRKWSCAGDEEVSSSACCSPA